MAAEVLNSSSVLRLNFSTKLKTCASISATSPSRKSLGDILTDTPKQMNQIEFIPLIEPATKKDKESEIIPSGTHLSNTKEWDIYQKKEIDKNYLNFPEPILSGTFQYNLFEISIEDLERVINLHIGDTDVNESISLFGGYAIK